jgi:hypothetical protein
LLSELVDGVIARDVRPEVEAHLERCAGCRSLLADLRRTREAARALPKMTAPESLVPKVRADFAAMAGPSKRMAHAPAASGHGAKTPRRFTVLRFVPRRPAVLTGLSAAAVVVLVVSAGLFVMSRRAAAPPPAAPALTATAAARQGAASPVNSQAASSVEAELDLADQHYQKAITALEQSARVGETALDPQTAAVLQKNMGVVDQAIRESRAALRTEPTSEAAQSSLFEALQRKVGLLRDTISLINEMRKGDAAGTARVAGTIGRL